ncbi:cytochrome P450 [Micromonospora chokoriensis]|uniref:cytochrome P450 n=1 Tax=Micromonospora chokoriensis TaxID=356851 RepID=UPI0009FE5C8D|nr:cytochrome P450 [Micromonospora chokoriensis]
MLMTGPAADELADPVGEIDLYDPARYAARSQHGAWHRLRRDHPIWPQETPDGIRFWSVTRYRDVAAVLMDDKNFSSEHGTILAVAAGDSAGGKTINLMDQPKHADVRLPTMRLMSTHTVRNRADQVRARVRRLVADVFDAGGTVDVAELMLHLPMCAVGETIGLPESIFDDLPRWAMAGVAPEDPQYAEGSPAETLRKAHHNLIAVFSELIRYKQAHPADDVVSVLLGLRPDGRPMDAHEVLLNCYSFAMGSVTTTAQVASHLILALAEQPEAWQRLRSTPGLVPAAVEESLRWASPTNHLLRRTNAPVEIAGTRLEAGELVAAWVASADRDDAIFADPYTFDPGRNPNPHLAFGLGPHRCIGGPPAQQVLGVLLEEMIDRLSEFHVAGPVTHLTSNFINGITSLPVDFQPVSARRAAVIT